MPVVHEWRVPVPQLLPGTWPADLEVTYLCSNGIWISSQQSVLETRSFKLLKKNVVIWARPPSGRSCRLPLLLWVSEGLLGCTLWCWKFLSPLKLTGSVSKSITFMRLKNSMCRSEKGRNSPRVGETWLQLLALSTAYASLKIWMKSISHCHCRDQNRQVFPVLPKVKFRALGSLCCRETFLWKNRVE